MGQQILNGSHAKMILNGVVYGNPRNFEPILLSLKWHNRTDPINYTYTVQEKGQYVAFCMYGDNGNNYFERQTIDTTGEMIFSYLSPEYRSARFCIINCEIGDSITIQSCNYAAGSYRNTCAAIYKVEVGKIKSATQMWDVYEPDKTSNLVTTTDLENNQTYLALTINCGQWNNTAYSQITGKFLSSDYSYGGYYDITLIYSFEAQITQYSRGTTAGMARNIGFILDLY